MRVDLPPIAGLVSRDLRRPHDYPAMAALLNRSLETEGIGQSATSDEIAATYDHLIGFDPEADMAVVELEENLVAYMLVEWRQELAGDWVYTIWGRVDPPFRRRGIGGALFAAAERRAVEIGASHPDGVKILETSSEGANPPAQTLIAAAGFQPTAHEALMVRPDLENIPAAPLPEGLEIRPVEPDHLRPIWEAAWQAFRDHAGAREPASDDWERFLTDPRRDESLWKIAWDGDGVVGQVRSFISPEENLRFGRHRGYTEDISTNRAWRRRGVAKALICASLRHLGDIGMTEAALGVHTENLTGAFRLYESLGYRVTETGTIYQKPLQRA